ncbi:tripartite tricarboxylate transporter permease [Caproicibacter sp.]|uniref:tripartite tricarboxylate transporter permease n=1 Tax=Caproicibacter sp. TaxID=2814884 RepID=UPI003988B942
MEAILAGLSQAFSIGNFISMAIGMAAGIVFGAVPGLNANIGIILCLPFTYGMQPIPAMLLLLSVFCGASFGGSISAILIGTPGTNNAAMTVLDGYPMAQKGQPFRGIVTALVASTIGGVVSALVLLLAAPFVSAVTIKFAPPELFTVSAFGLSIIAAISGKNFWKGLLSGSVGVLVSLIGLDSLTGKSRFIFDDFSLMNGLSLASVLMGMFALVVILEKVKDILSADAADAGQKAVQMKKSKTDRFTGADFKLCMPHIIRSTLLGIVIGAIPGVGGGVASVIGYDTARRTSKNPEEFGTGRIEGVAASEAANNAVTGSALIPTLTLGVPGAPAAATLMAAFMIHGLTPGPLLFSEDGPTVYAILIGLVIANLLMLVIGRALNSAFISIIKVPLEILVPALAMTCIAGAYSDSNSMVNVYTLMIFGLLSYIFSLVKIPSIPLILGFILGPLTESNLRKSLVMSDGSFMIFLQRPICVFFILLTIVFVICLKFDVKDFMKSCFKRKRSAVQ